MEKFLQDLNISEKGYYSKDKSYIIDIENSDSFGRYYSKLTKSDLLEENEDASLITQDNSSIVFDGEGYQLVLMADFDQDTYKLVCQEIKGDK